MISRELLERVASAVNTTADQVELRRQFPGVPITVCSDDDIPTRLTAAHETTVACFYYLDANEHCVKLSTDADSASGIVVGLLGDD
jgi:phage/plasmid primase-like uncharacterized protein